MISASQVFKFILSIILSGFVLVFAFDFIVSYSASQQELAQAKVLSNFKVAALQTYLEGTPASFSGLGKVPGLRFDANENSLDASVHIYLTHPILFVSSDPISIERLSQDYSWWRFDYVLAVPKAEVIFSPQGSASDWKAVSDIVSSFPIDSKAVFGLCDGQRKLLDLCEGAVCSRDGFLKLIESPSGAQLAACSLDSPVLAVSGQCSIGSGSVCINLQQGKIYSAGKAYDYTGPKDALFLLFGSQKHYGYINKLFNAQLSAMLEVSMLDADITAKESASFLSGIRQSRQQLSQKIKDQQAFIAREQGQLLLAKESQKAAKQRVIDVTRQALDDSMVCLSGYDSLISSLSGTIDKGSAEKLQKTISELEGLDCQLPERFGELKCSVEKYNTMRPAFSRIISLLSGGGSGLAQALEDSGKAYGSLGEGCA